MKSKLFPLGHSSSLLMAYVYFAYWLGILQDFYYGVVYSVNVVQQRAITGPAAFMFGWTVFMLWGVWRPLERRVTLLLTAVLVIFMIGEKLLLAAVTHSDPAVLINVLGALLWFSAYFAAGKVSERSSQTAQ